MKRKFISIIIAVVLAMATCMTLIACVPNKAKQNESNVAISENGFMTENKMYALPKAMSFSQKGLDRSVTNSVSVNVYATVYPETAPNKAVDWAVEWGDVSKTSNVNDYITVTPESDGSANAVITCYQAFEGDILITVTTREGKFTDSCIVTFIGKPTELSIEGEALGMASAAFGSYIKIGTGNTYEFDLVASNVFGNVGADCEYTYELKGYGSIVTKDNSINTTTDAITWKDGTEQTINLNDIERVNPSYSSMFAITIDGNKLMVKANCTPESYYTSQNRISSSKIETDNDFFKYTNDNWYYEIIVTEVNSGISDTIVVRPVNSVTRVVMSMGDYQF